MPEQLSDKNNIILRFTVPTRFDLAPYGTLCKVQADSEHDYKWYIQLSKDEDYSNWLSLGDFFEIIFEDNINEPDFIRDSLEIYNSKIK